jgi:hypothetical protein
MPLYEYRCHNGHSHTILRKYVHRDGPFICSCGNASKRVPSAPARTKFRWGDTEWDGRRDRGLGVTLRDENHRKQLMKQRGLRELGEGEVEAEVSRVTSEHQQHERDMQTFDRVLNETGSAATAMAQTFPDPPTTD